MAGKKWSYKELENMTYEEYRNIFFEDIPSGNESEDDQNWSDEDFVDVDVHNATNTNNDVGIHPERVSDSDSSYSDDDLIPLADLQKKLSLDKFVWEKVSTNYTAPQEFTKDSGPCNISDDMERPVEVFLCPFPDSLFYHIVFQTNLYATQASARSGKLFTPTNTMEMKKFVAINILMGIKRLPSYRDFWSTQIELRDKYISSLIPRTRFDWLLGNVHLNDNVMQPKRGEPLYDKLYKVRPILQILSENYAKYYKPTKNVSLRQHMPNKPIKRGYKLWVRASESGYVNHFQIYTGKIGEKNWVPGW
ncbi:unnamed protein product [Acanthoscelides obtectus]|uniref:PiggyBac transposable element-derived protein domain-containing protein n=1 Tax=Acanthoscelides obtectus TaxID=200917 RepID=A0A9P0PUT3_ACAOB|nr:unnamed protein product [Acanthoscelides obtectus]CAK1627052.1 PiggyBac transposable element-derived protein 3 [Acanthoscelides obtectus]